MLRALYDNTGDTPSSTGFDLRGFAGGCPQTIAAAGGGTWFVYYRDCTQDVQREAKHFGLESAAWSANLRDRDALVRLVDTDPDAVCLDCPDVDLDALRSKG